MRSFNINAGQVLVAACLLVALFCANGCGAGYSYSAQGPGGNFGGGSGGGSGGNPSPPGNPAAQIPSGVVVMTYTGPGGTVYDSTHKYLFVTLTKFDRVDVFSTVDDHLVASIPVPAPMGIDISTDNTQVFVASGIPSFFVIDSQSLRLVGQTSIPVQGTGNVQVVAPTGLARSSTGNVLLLVNVLNTSDSETLAEWNSTTGQITYRQDFPSPPACITSSADHTKILVGACGINFVGGPGEEVGLYDAASDSFTAALYGFGYLDGIAANPNGTQFSASVGDNTLIILDANFNVLQTISGSTLGMEFLVGDLVYSRDGRYLYILEANPGAGANVTVLDTTTFSVVGTRFTANGGSSYPLPQFLQPPSIDENNILYVPLGGSVGVTPTPQTPFHVTPNLITVTPPQGFSQSASSTIVSGDAPQQGFAVQNGGSASGGTSSQMFIFGSPSASATIGGEPASVSNVQPGGNFSSAAPGWMVGMTLGAPPGREGLASVSIGSLTMQNAFNYVGEQIVPITGTPWQLVHDPGRQQLYISNATENRVEVYSLTSQKLLNPIPVGKAPHGLALTSDGSLLAVANSGDGTVTLVNPDNVAGAMTIALGTVGGTQPNEVVITNTGQALVTYAPDFMEVDLSNHTVTPLSDHRIYLPELLSASKDGSEVVCDCGSLGIWSPATNKWTFTSYEDEAVPDGAISGDGTIVAQGNYILNPQLVITGQLAEWEFLPVPESISGHSDILNASGSLVYKTDEGSNAIDPTGIQIFDTNHGDLKEWIELAEPVALNSQHALTLDDTGQNLYVLTRSGFTALHFAYVPLSVGHLTPNQGPAAGGTTVTIRGSGFEPGCKVSFNNTPAATTFVDSQTVTVVTPSMRPGPVQLNLQTPDGQVYSLDSAFAAQ
jgi:DNA-binding beta-propeller fold protein YncE